MQFFFVLKVYHSDAVLLMLKFLLEVANGVGFDVRVSWALAYVVAQLFAALTLHTSEKDAVRQ